MSYTHDKINSNCTVFSRIQKYNREFSWGLHNEPYIFTARPLYHRPKDSIFPGKEPYNSAKSTLSLQTKSPISSPKEPHMSSKDFYMDFYVRIFIRIFISPPTRPLITWILVTTQDRFLDARRGEFFISAKRALHLHTKRALNIRQNSPISPQKEP